MLYRSTADARSVRLRRARPAIALAAVAFAIGAIVGANSTSSPAHALASRFVSAWTKRDWAHMYQDIDASSQRAVSAGQFAGDYERALRTATATRLRVAGRLRDLPGGAVQVPVLVHTRLFGTLALSFQIKVLAGAGRGGEGDAVAWSPSLAFPGLHRRESLVRHAELPPRARLLAHDGSVLAEGSPATPGQRSSPLGASASAALGEVGPLPESRRAALEGEGVPPTAIVGTSGIELALDDRLRGTPGGQLLAVGARPETDSRVLASAPASAAPDVRTTISPALQRAAVVALGGQLGGVVVLNPRSGEVLAVAGLGLSSVQPPGSTFKMVTLSGVLEAGVAAPSSVFPYATYATLDGVRLNNAGGESCGGSLEMAFAVSCNSVFAPLGAKLGAQRLVATAERFGFNSEPGIAGAAESTLPHASGISGDLDTGSSAIGQGQVQASTLQMAIVAATIADGGRRPKPTFTPVSHPQATRAISPAVARTVRRMMIEVVRNGTGTSAAIPGVVVAGKTGTAELKSECTTGASEPSGEAGAKEAGSEGCQGSASEPSNTDAWFAAFAPALHPRVGVGVLLVKDGAGGATAAPVAREVLEAGLSSRG